MKKLFHRWIFLILCFVLTAGCFAFLLLYKRYPALDYVAEPAHEHTHTTVNTPSYNLYHYIDQKINMTQFKTETEPEESAPVKSFIFHKVRSGDTLWKIALMYDVSIDTLVIDNDIHNPDRIFQGTVLKIRNDAGKAP